MEFWQIVLVGDAILVLYSSVIFAVHLRNFIQHRLDILLANCVVSICLLVSVTLTSLSNFSSDQGIAYLCFTIADFALVCTWILIIILLSLLRLEKMGLLYTAILILVLIIKAVTVNIFPLKIEKLDRVNLYEVYGSVFPAIIYIFLTTLLIGELILLLLRIKNLDAKKWIIRLLPSLIFAFLIIPISLLSYTSENFEIISYYLMVMLLSTEVFSFYLMFGKDFPELVFSLSQIQGILLHTYGGLPILREALSPEAKKIIPLASSLIASLISIEHTIEKKQFVNKFRTHKLLDRVILMYFGKVSIGIIIAKRSNLALRNILKNFVKKFESEIKYVNEGMILDSDMKAAESVLRDIM